MIEAGEIREASAELTRALEEQRLAWIVDAVNQKESEIAATADLLKIRTERHRDLVAKARAKNKKPPKEESLPFELNDWDFLDEHYRRLLLLMVGIDQYCVGPFHAVRAAEASLKNRLDAPTNLTTEILKSPPSQAVDKLHHAVLRMADYLRENSGDERVLKILQQWRRGQ